MQMQSEAIPKDAPIVEFYNDAKEDRAATAEEGRPMFRDVEMVRLRFPADRNRTLTRPAHAEWKKENGQVVTYAMRFGDDYKRFKANESPVVKGTPVSELPFLTEASRRMLRALDVYTAEQLASLEGQPLKNIGMNGREWQQAAKAFLAKANGTADVTRMASEIATLKEELDKYRSSPQQAEPEQPDPDINAADFDAMDDADIKAWIKERTGAAPKGNPSRETLLTTARDLAAQG